MLVIYHLDYCSFRASLEIKYYKSSNSILLKIALAILDTLLFHVNVRIGLSISTKMLADVLTGILLIMKINLERIKILTILGLSIYECSTPLYLFRSLFISLINVR